MLTGESRFLISTRLGIEPVSLMIGSKRVDHWTSGSVYECSEIAGSPQYRLYFDDLSRIPCEEDQLANTYVEKNIFWHVKKKQFFQSSSTFLEVCEVQFV